MKRPLFTLVTVGIIAAIVLLWQRPDKLPQADTQQNLFFPDYDAKQVVHIEIEQLLYGAQLKKVGEDWQVASLVSRAKQDLLKNELRPMPKITWSPADRSRINAALGVFGDLERGVVVSRNPEKQALYQVGAQGLQVRLFDAQQQLLGNIIIGKNGPDVVSSYARRADELEVYLLSQSLLGVFSIEADDWKLRAEAASAPTETLSASPKK